MPNFLINLIHQSIAICTKRAARSATQFIASWNDSVTQLANSHVGDAILQNKIPGNQQNILGQFIRTASLVIQIIPSVLQDHFLGLQRFNPPAPPFHAAIINSVVSSADSIDQNASQNCVPQIEHLWGKITRKGLCMRLYCHSHVR